MDSTKSIQEDIPESALAGLSEESRECILRLKRYRAPPLPDFGLVKQAAVLVPLFQKPGDDKLSVLLTTRAKTLRRHPNQTALPGGKVDPEDPSPIHTARREAFEEVSLPLKHPSIHHLTTLEPVLTILPLNAHFKNHIIAIPVVCLISDLSIIENLKGSPDEVERIFSHPLKGCHTGRVEGKDEEALVERGSEHWPHEEEFHSIEDRIGATGGYRMHRFRSSYTPIKGLTSDILINTAAVAYGSPPSFERWAPQQPEFSTVIANVVLELPGVINSTASEGEAKVLEWGGTEAGVRIRSGETWHSLA
ncbi:NUDIX hydrolase domain-like protein [Naematelia encephala]|uniref:NUDIX hydrolase domain-like protein n=1 Tax=Naematelia encephala TaxID=71784 RepID=A0A1Y2B779_9TREE|nr:NUDIX hydrolase domain-like protein [Naematelia encephala]